MTSSKMKISWLWILNSVCWAFVSVVVQAEETNTAEQPALSGQTQWRQQVSLGLTASGMIETVNVKLGDKVKAGQRLLSLQQTVFQADVAVAWAALKQAKAAHTEAARELERTQALA